MKGGTENTGTWTENLYLLVWGWGLVLVVQAPSLLTK